MGAVGSVLGSALFGLGMSGMSGKANYQYGTDVNSEMTSALPAAVEAPTANANDSAKTDNAAMEAEREKERQKAAWRREQAREVFTSGLGAEGLAETNRKSLLGG